MYNIFNNDSIRLLKKRPNIQAPLIFPTTLIYLNIGKFQYAFSDAPLLTKTTEIQMRLICLENVSDGSPDSMLYCTLSE